MADQHERVSALRFKQWLDIWDTYDFDSEALRRRPQPYLYMFSMSAARLRALCDVYKREREGASAEGIQRLRDPSRTGRIQRYVRYGYPFGDLNAPQRTVETFPLRKPGWLPTALVLNILVDGDRRRGRTVDPKHLIDIHESEPGRFELRVPEIGDPAEDWLAPMEVIDGQHRLWAFGEGVGQEPIPDDFELPVVAFQGLDIAWQAYLFWSINVSPKKINPSHAFDLYPLLRTQDWLERVGELKVYREARAQELTELMYSHSASPWAGRINMLGEKGSGGVSQNAWVRALLSTVLATGRGQGRPGLFQSDLEEQGTPLDWTRPQQAAFVIKLWSDIQEAIAENPTQYWIREYKKDAWRAFTDKTSWLNQDQGVRAVMNVANDLFYEFAYHWRLSDWVFPSEAESTTTPEEVDSALKSLDSTYFRPRIRELANALVMFDWRSLDGPGVKGDESVEVQKRSYRGSGGYAALRLDVLEAVAGEGGEVGGAARNLIEAEAA